MQDNGNVKLIHSNRLEAPLPSRVDSQEEVYLIKIANISVSCTGLHGFNDWINRTNKIFQATIRATFRDRIYAQSFFFIAICINDFSGIFFQTSLSRLQVKNCLLKRFFGEGLRIRNYQLTLSSWTFRLQSYFGSLVYPVSSRNTRLTPYEFAYIRTNLITLRLTFSTFLSHSIIFFSFFWILFWNLYKWNWKH